MFNNRQKIYNFDLILIAITDTIRTERSNSERVEAVYKPVHLIKILVIG